MESVRYSLVLVLILMIVDDIHSQQDAMSDMRQSCKDKQEHDINEIKDAIRNISQSIQEMKNNNEKQREDFSKIKDAVKDISQWMKNVSYQSDRTCKNPGLLCTRPNKYMILTDGATFLQAFQNCEAKNMTLASIESQAEYNILYAYMKPITTDGDHYWTSGMRNDARSEFFWKLSGKSLSYTKWYSPDYPLSYPEFNCLGIYIYNHNNAVMYNRPCTYVEKYVCEYR